MTKQSKVAFDYASVRSIDADGRLHIEWANISKANVCPYYGEEIPGCQELGLDKHKIYQLLRDPHELEKAAHTFNKLPVLDEHHLANADDPKQDKVVGATGEQAEFKDPFLCNSLVVWVGDAIERIENGSQREISCAYRYTPDMTPGTYEGEKYDGVMRNIIGSHVALVSQGRAGPEVVVGDSMKIKSTKHNGVKNMGQTLSKKAVMAKGALMAVLKPAMLATDSQINLNQILAGVKKKNWLNKKPGIAAAIKPHLAKDADITQIMELLDKLDSAQPDDDNLGVDDSDMDMSDMSDMPAEDDDMCSQVLAKLRGKISDADLSEIEAMLKAPKAMDDVPQTANGEPENGIEMMKAKKAEDAYDEDEDKDKDKENMMDKAAMDRAIKLACEATARDATQKTIARLRSIAEAEEAVRPYVGKLTAMDSGEAVYKAALEALKIDINGVHPSAYRHILLAQPNPNAPRHTSMASDRALSSDVMDMFPDLTRV